MLKTSDVWLSGNTLDTLYHLRGMIWRQEFMNDIYTKTLYHTHTSIKCVYRCINTHVTLTFFLSYCYHTCRVQMHNEGGYGALPIGVRRRGGVIILRGTWHDLLVGG